MISDDMMIFCIDCNFEDSLEFFKQESEREFNKYDVRSGLPEFYLRTDDDIFEEVIRKKGSFSYEYGFTPYDYDSIFKEHNADPRDDESVPKMFQERCWNVWNRLRRMAEIKGNTETLMFWGLNHDEAESLAKVESVEKTHHGDRVVGRYSWSSELAEITKRDISKYCHVDSTRAAEIWDIFTPIRGKHKFDYDDTSAEKFDWLENCYKPWINEMKKKEILVNLGDGGFLEKGLQWSMDLGLKKLTGPEFCLYLFEEGFDLIGEDRKILHNLVNEQLSA